MRHSLFVFALLMLASACSSTVSKLNQAEYSAESAIGTIDRAIATEERERGRFGK